MIPMIFFLLSFIEGGPIYEINRGEAEYYRLFTDIDSFISAHFYENGDTVEIKILYSANGDTLDSLVMIEKKVFEALKFYQRNFHKIITDIKFREDFIDNFVISWPILAKQAIEKEQGKVLERSILNSTCCITGTSAAGAYIGALTGKKVYKVTGGVPCMITDNTSCVIPYQYYQYTVDPNHFYIGTASGLIVGGLCSKKLYFERNNRIKLLNALSKDILAFDDNGNPITITEIEKENEGKYKFGFGIPGILIGSCFTLAEIYGLYYPWSDLVPKTDWDEKAVSIPIIVISGVTFLEFTKIAFEKGDELDRMATIEKIKKKRKEQMEKK